MDIDWKWHEMQLEVTKVDSIELISIFQLPRECNKIDMLLREVIYGNRDKQSQKASMKLWRRWQQILIEEEVAGWRSTITGERL